MVVVKEDRVQSFSVFPAEVVFFAGQKDCSTLGAGEINLNQYRSKDVGSKGCW